MNVVIVSFATFGPPYRDYSKRVAVLQDFCIQSGIVLEIYDVQRIIKSPHYNFNNSYFQLKRGAGYWHWKPVVLLDAHDLHPDALIIYLDIDFDLIAVPLAQLETMARKNYSLSLFRTNLYLRDCSSKVFWSTLQITREVKMSIASVVIANFSIEQTTNILKKWLELNDMPRLLLDPIFVLNTKHRHDQSILSYIVDKEKEHILFLEDGYWAESKEAYNMKKENAWVRMHQESNNIEMSKMKQFYDYIKFLLWTLKNRVMIFWFYYEM